MPKTLADGSQRASAKDRKADKERAERDRSEREKEDARWEDSDRGVAKKQQRADERLKKQEQAAQRKAENKALAAAEEASVSPSRGGKTPPKVSRASIQVSQDAEKARLAKLAASMEAEKRGAVKRQDPLEENPNKVMAEMLEDEGAFEARSVEDAIHLLNIKGAGAEAMSRRVKAAYAQFREEMLPELQKENPMLRRSQLLEAVHKEWQRSPRNPANQPS